MTYTITETFVVNTYHMPECGELLLQLKYLLRLILEADLLRQFAQTTVNARTIHDC